MIILEKRLLAYLAILAIIISFFFGIAMKFLVNTGMNYATNYNRY